MAMKKQAHLQGITRDAQMADGGVEFVTSEIPGATYDGKKAAQIAALVQQGLRHASPRHAEGQPHSVSGSSDWGGGSC